MVPAEVAIYKGVKTKNPSLVKRICIIWESWYSPPGYTLAVEFPFIWGIEHIQTDEPASSSILGGIYVVSGYIDKVDPMIIPNVSLPVLYANMDKVSSYLTQRPRKCMPV